MLAVTAPLSPPLSGPAPPPLPLRFPTPSSFLRPLLPPPDPLHTIDTSRWTPEDTRLIPPDQVALALRTWQRLPLDPHIRDIRRKILYYKVPTNHTTVTWAPTSYRHPRQPPAPTASCPHCRADRETPLHALWHCPTARQVWIMASRVLDHPSLRPPHSTPATTLLWHDALLGTTPDAPLLSALPNARRPGSLPLRTYIRRQLITSLAIATIWALRWSPSLTDNPPPALVQAQFLRTVHRGLALACQRPSHSSSPVYPPPIVIGESHPLTLPPPSPPFCIPTLADCPTVYSTII